MNKEQEQIYKELSAPIHSGKQYEPTLRNRSLKLIEFQNNIDSLPILLDVKPKYKNGNPFKKVKRSATKK